MNDTTVDDGHAGDRERVSPWFTETSADADAEPPQGIEPAAAESAAGRLATEQRADESAAEAVAAPEPVAGQGNAAEEQVGEYPDGGYDDAESGAYAEDYGYDEDYADWDGEYDLVYEDGVDGVDPRSRRNRLGVAALVLGLVGLFPIGLVLGVIALLRRRRRKVAALSAVLLAVAWSVGVGMFWGQLGAAVPRAQAYGAKVLSLVRGAEAVRENGAQSGNAFGDGVFALRVGDCFLSTPGQDGKPVTHNVPCDLPHEGQVFYQFDLPDRNYPDQDSIETAAMSTCHTWSNQVLDKRRIVPAMQLQAAFPQRLALAAGHRTVSCVVSEQGGMLTTSMLLP